MVGHAFLWLFVEIECAHGGVQRAAGEEELPAVAAIGAPEGGGAHGGEEQGADVVHDFRLAQPLCRTADEDAPGRFACGFLVGGGEAGDEGVVV